MLPNTRTSRSRFSSPAQSSRPSETPAKETGMEKGKEVTEGWVEPAQQSAPSYLEAGLVKGGVVENMHALGTLPKPSVVKKLNQQLLGAAAAAAGQEVPRKSRIILKNRAAGTKTPTPTPTSTPGNFTPTPTLPPVSMEELTPVPDHPELVPISAARRSITSRDIDDDDEELPPPPTLRVNEFDDNVISQPTPLSTQPPFSRPQDIDEDNSTPKSFSPQPISRPDVSHRSSSHTSVAHRSSPAGLVQQEEATYSQIASSQVAPLQAAPLKVTVSQIQPAEYPSLVQRGVATSPQNQQVLPDVRPASVQQEVAKPLPGARPNFVQQEVSRSPQIPQVLPNNPSNFVQQQVAKPVQGSQRLSETSASFVQQKVAKPPQAPQVLTNERPSFVQQQVTKPVQASQVLPEARPNFVQQASAVPSQASQVLPAARQSLIQQGVALPSPGPAPLSRDDRSGLIQQQNTAMPSQTRQGVLDPLVRVQDEAVKNHIANTVTVAVEQALTHRRHPTAWALRKLYDKNSEDPHFLVLIQSVFRQTATPDAFKEFRSRLEPLKKEGKADDKGFFYFEAEEGKTPGAHKAKPAPFADLVKKLDPSTTNSATNADNNTVDKATDNHVEADEDVTPAHKKVKTSHPRESSARKMAAHGVNGTVSDTPSRRSKRAGSAGSDSSGLSSARSVTPPPAHVDEDETMQDFGDDDFGVPSRGRRSAESPSTASVPTAAAPRPMTARARAATKKKNANVSPELDPILQNTNSSSLPPQSSSTPTPAPNDDGLPTTTTAEGAAGMPAAVASPLFPRLPTKKGKRHTLGEFEPSLKLAEDDPRTVLQRNARTLTTTNTRASLIDSWERSHAADPEPDSDFELPVPSAVRPRASLPPGPVSSARATRSRKRQNDEIEDDASPTSLNFPFETGASSRVGSRAGTPNPRAAKKQRTGLRVKSSPVKQKPGPSAGIPRASGERPSPPVNGVSQPQSDPNDDYCSSCGGTGEIVCCDGCTRAFHFLCLEYPLEPVGEGDLEDWYCQECFYAKFPTRHEEYSGAFAGLLNILQKRNSSAFRLPKDLRAYFEGVKTGIDGEYEEIVPAAKAKKNKAQAEPETDFYRLRDADGNAVLCHSCSKSAGPARAILPCSLCGLNWHIDCLDPPQANPPLPRNFKCPLHVDDLLAKIPGNLAPAHKFRKIKGASNIRPAFTRGNINNGFIEIEDDSSDDNDSGWTDPSSFGHYYTLPAKGVSGDFTFKALKRILTQEAPRPRVRTTPLQPARPLVVPDNEIELDRQQAALNMVRLSQGLQQQSGVGTLVNALIDNATPAMVKMMARGRGDKINSEVLDFADHQSLLAMQQQMAFMQEQIAARLAKVAPPQSSHIPMDAVVGNHSPGPMSNTIEPAVQKQRLASPPTESAVTMTHKTAAESVPSPSAETQAEPKLESFVESIANVAAHIDDKIDGEPALQSSLESALTPVSVSEAAKDTNELATPISKEVEPKTVSAPNGIETPETEAMDLDMD